MSERIEVSSLQNPFNRAESAEYRVHLQGLEPERLVEYLRKFQTRLVRSTIAVGAGISLMPGSYAVHRVLGEMGISGDGYLLAANLGVIVGAFTALFAFKGGIRAYESLSLVNQEVEKRLVSPS